MKRKAAGSIVSDRYQVDKVLGEGAMGVVYKATDTRLDRPIALKLIALGGEGKERDEMQQRVLREAQTPAKMNHPGIVTIYDYGVEEDYAFIAMEFVEGRTLEWFIGQYGRIPVKKTVEIMERICDALRVAHDLSFIHRDIKPANIMILRDGSVKVMDFGLAKGTQPSDLNVTKAGMLIGTPKYMSPEQIRGKNLDAKTDIYSLGVVLFEMLTGKTPYTAKDIYGLLNAVLNEEPPKPSERYKKLPRIFDEVVLKALAKSPDQRYGTVAALATELKSTVEKLIEMKKMADSGRAMPPERQETEKKRVAKNDVSASQQKLAISALKDKPSDDDLGIPDLDNLVDNEKGGKARVTKEGGAQTVVSTMALHNRWQDKVKEETRYRKENLCAYGFQSPDAVQGYCSEPKFPKSNGGFCVLHDPSIDKGKLNIRGNLEKRVQKKQDLEGIILRKVELIDSQLQGALLAYSDFSGAILNGANLYEANLSSAKLENTRLDRVNLLSARLIGAQLHGTQLRSARLKNAILRKGEFDRANLQSCDCREADFSEATLIRTDFNRTDLTKATFQKAKLNGCDFRNAKFIEGNLKNAVFAGCNFRGALFRGASFRKTSFQKSEIERADFSNLKLREANFSLVVGTGASFEKADLWGVDFSGADLRNANLQNADLSRAILDGANLEGANLKGANLRRTSLKGTNLTKARLSDADLVEADLQNAKMHGVEVGGADFTGAQITIEAFPVSEIPTWNQAIWDQDTKSQLDMKSWGLD